jgi:hypothetical protein
MKYLTLVFAIAFFSCSTESSKSNLAEAEDEVVEETSKEEAEKVAPVVETVIVKDSDINEDEYVREAFLNMIDAVNNATEENVESSAMVFLGSEYVFKGEDRTKSIARLKKQFASFKFEITDVDIKQLKSSCDLAYLIVSFKKTIKNRATGEVKIDAKEKIGLFIMHKDTTGLWKLRVQKTDNGFSHWYYMPEKN